MSAGKHLGEDRPGTRLACPHCLSPDYLGEYVQGWREVRLPVRMIDGRVVTVSRGSVYDAERVSWFCSNEDAGCNVDTELRDSKLVQIDDEGRPIKQPAEQERLI